MPPGNTVYPFGGVTTNIELAVGPAEVVGFMLLKNKCNKINNKGLLYSMGNYIHYLAVTYNRRKPEKDSLNHFAIYLKHRKSAITQF